MKRHAALFAGLVLSETERAAFLEEIRPQVSPEHLGLIAGMTQALPQLLKLLDEGQLTMEQLRKVAFGAPTEKTATVCPATATAAPPPKTRPKPRNHGRRGSKAYTGARRVKVPHPNLRAGQTCPECKTGKLRPSRTATALHVQGQPPIAATVHELEVLRCQRCGKTFTAPTPPEAGTQKYDPSVGVMVGLLRYGSGLPFYRLAQWQTSLGVPLPASTQWEQVDAVARVLEPVGDHLATLAAQAPTMHNDDTTMRVGALRQEIKQEVKPKRTGIFTTSVVTQGADPPIALFFTSRQHAGENLDQILRQRSTALSPPLQMCDGLNRNEPSQAPTLLACCLAHGRRGFVEIASHFPDECRFVLECLRTVYHADAQARQDRLSPEARLGLHQSISQPVMDQLHTWMAQQIENKLVEPNSGLGQAIGYMQKRWVELNRFLHQPGAPLDNNICERALKMAVLHRKNSLAYKTERGAKVGDLFMGLIQTCRLNLINPFHYFMALMANPAAVLADPGRFLPWNYTAACSAPSLSPASHP
jgi:transposase